MFVRKKKNKSGLVSVQVIDKSNGKYKVLKTIGCSSQESELEKLVNEGKIFIKKLTGTQELDFTDHKNIYAEVLSSISTLKLVGVQLVLGNIFNQIGFGQIQDSLFKDLVMYRLVYPKSKLKTSEYMYRFEQKSCTEDDLYRYMDKLQSKQKDLVQQISYAHTVKVLGGIIQAVFYDVTTLYFEIEQEDELRKTGFSKEGKHQHPQILLGLLVSANAYPLAYDIFEGNKYEGDTFLPVLEEFRNKYHFDRLTVVADAGLLSNKNIEQLQSKGYEFIIGARIKNERRSVTDRILQLQLDHGQAQVIDKDGMKLIIHYSEDRAKKDRYNRERGLKRLNRKIKTGKLTKSNISNNGYNKFLKLSGDLNVAIDEQKIEQDQKWDGLKGYLTNSSLSTEQILENYHHLWQIEKAFRVAKSELKIRPIYHYKRRRIEAHICLNFVAYKVYKELERQLKEKNSNLSPEKVIEIIQTIFQITLTTPNNELLTKTLILSAEQKEMQKLFNF